MCVCMYVCMYVCVCVCVCVCVYSHACVHDVLHGHAIQLVMQQMDACRQIVGIPASMIVDFSEKAKKDRQGLWNSKRVFFGTPQVRLVEFASRRLSRVTVDLPLLGSLDGIFGDRYL